MLSFLLTRYQAEVNRSMGVYRQKYEDWFNGLSEAERELTCKTRIRVAQIEEADKLDHDKYDKEITRQVKESNLINAGVLLPRGDTSNTVQ